VRQGGGWVGKCPKSITDQVAQNLLNQAVPEPDPFRLPGRVSAWPKRLYAVHKGVIYEAVPTIPGKSYHGYPWRAREGRGPLPTEVIDRLRNMANDEGCLEQFEEWLDQHS
jgi:hypothetical protein